MTDLSRRNLFGVMAGAAVAPLVPCSFVEAVAEPETKYFCFVPRTWVYARYENVFWTDSEDINVWRAA